MCHPEIVNEIQKMFVCPKLEKDRYEEVFGEGQRPLLFLLRRDLQDFQYGAEDAQPTDDGMHSPLLTCLGVMVGLELLTKLWAGQIEIKRETLKQFLCEFASLSPDKADALVRFRNSVAHTYSLTDIAKDGKKYQFNVDADANRANDEIHITRNGKERNVYLNVWWLKKMFLESIAKYKRKLDVGLELQCKFFVAQQELGKIQIRKSVKSPD